MNWRFALSLLLLLAVGACSSSEDDKPETHKKDIADKKVEHVKEAPLPICPHVAIVRDLEDMKDFGTEKPDPSELVSEAKMINVDGGCDYTDDGVNVTFDLNMMAAKGPRLGGSHVSFPYFIAVMAPSQTILTKDKMTVEFTFPSDKKITDKAEPLHVFIPLPKAQRTTGPDYQVLIGFQLDEDQVKEKRAAVSAKH